ncbi:TonB dependent receptor [Sphingomonas gellani]|uniref:TonB dependent receptor n=1 Tax=Sphingomonas gellani TaxID=1166340 RepID=A0A1H7XYD5_9SPHN|nr:TonB-dependent receptor [Sphingomonas gellani]SEM38840.1 TonB dependent receptor [Sphingomonas gellani]
MMLRHSVSLIALGGALGIAVPATAQQAVDTAGDGQAAAASSRDGAATDQTAPTPDGLTPGQQVPNSSATRRNAISGVANTPTESSVGDVVVTGTRIQRPNSASAAPITSVTSADIKAQAPVNVEEVLNRLPQVAPDNQQTYQDSDGRQRIKLRSLGFERTLVLIDGKRIGTQNGQDTNIIPVSLLERVDILTGGASSVYGSDAVAGVVNFILKPDFDGVRIDANYNFYNHDNKANIVTPVAQASGFSPLLGKVNDGGRADVTLTVGKRLFDGKLNLSGFVNYKHQDLIPYDSRSTSACQIGQTSKDGPLSCSLSTYSISGYISPRAGANSGRAYINDPNGARTFVPYGVGVGNAANPYDGYSYQRQLNRLNAGGFVTLKLAPEYEVYGSALWFRDKSINRYPTRVFAAANYDAGVYQVNCDNPFLSASQRTVLCGAQTTGLVPLDIRYRFNGLPYQVDSYLNKGIRATGGIRGKVDEVWTYDVGGVYARNQQDWNSSRLSNYTNVNRSLNVVNVNGTPTCVSKVNGTDPNCIPFDAFSAGNNNQALVDYFYSGVDPAIQTTVGILYDFQANMTGDLGKYGITSPFAHDGVAIALGTEFRKDRQFSTSTPGFREDYGGTDSDRSQHVWESNAELQLPLVQEQRFAHLLQANLGGRLSKYSSNPSTFTTWKAEGLYAPVPDLTLRASFNKAQRAPTVVEAFQASNISYGRQGGSQNDFCAPTALTDPKTGLPQTDGNGQQLYGAPIASRDVCRATGLSDALYGSRTLLCPDNQCTTRSGGFTADPETAYTQTYGLVVKPRFIRGLTFSVDRYRIKINNSLGYNDYTYYTDGCLRSGGDAFFCSGIVRAPDGTLYSPPSSNPTSGYIRQGTSNYYFSIARGYDFQANYALGLGGAGRMDFDFNGSLTTFAGSQDSPVQPQRNCVGYFRNGCNQLLPKWTHTLRTTYTLPDNVFSASLNWRYVGSLTSATNSGDPAINGYSATDNPNPARTTFYHIAPQSYFDLALTFNIAQRYSLRLIANNLLDKSPPIVANSYDISLARSNTIPQRYDSLGRNIAISTTIQF